MDDARLLFESFYPDGLIPVGALRSCMLQIGCAEELLDSLIAESLIGRSQVSVQRFLVLLALPCATTLPARTQPEQISCSTVVSRHIDMSAAVPFAVVSGDDKLKETPLPQEKFKLESSEGKKKVLLVACGSFSPPTCFHLRMMEDARDELIAKGYHVVGGFLSPVHQKYGKASLVPMYHRINMVGLALQDSEWLQVDAWECSQAEYTVTAKVLEQRFKKGVPSDVQVLFVCGGDLVESFAAIKENGERVWAEEDVEIILGQCGVCCMGREGTDLDKVIEENEQLKKNKVNIVQFRPSVQNNISSTLVRGMLQQKKSLKYLVHDGALKYIHEQDLVSYAQWGGKKAS